METTQEPWIDSTEVGRRMGMTRGAVMELVRRGTIPAIRIGTRAYRFDWQEVLQAVERLPGHGQEGGPDTAA